MGQMPQPTLQETERVGLASSESSREGLGNTNGGTWILGYLELPEGLQCQHSLRTYCVLGAVLGDSLTLSHLKLRAVL